MDLNAFKRSHWPRFILLGALLFSGKSFLIPEDRPALSVPQARLEAAILAWTRAAGRIPSASERRAIKQYEFDQEMLFREGLRRRYHLRDTLIQRRLARDMRFMRPKLSERSDAELAHEAFALGLHQSELVVRRRLIQRVELAAEQAYLARGGPNAEQLEVLRQEFSSQLLSPERVTIRQIFFSADTRRNPEADARAALRDTVFEARKIKHGDAFLHGVHFKAINRPRLITLFGERFAEQALQAAKTGGDTRWQGPFISSYGAHLAQLSNYIPELPLSAELAAEKLRAEWRRRARERARIELIKRLRPLYQYVQNPETGA